MKKNILTRGLWILGFVLAGCATMSVNSDWDTRADFSKLRTYAWTSESQPRTQDPRLNNTLLDSRIRNAIDQTLSDRGYQKIPTGTPDFQVSYQAAIEKKMDVTQVSMPYQMPYTTVSGGVVRVNPMWNVHGRTDTFVTQYDEGTLLLDVVDPKTNSLIWRGTAKKAIDEKSTPEKREANIRKAVQKILAGFPPVSGN